jgi:hypothetical protein
MTSLQILLRKKKKRTKDWMKAIRLKNPRRVRMQVKFYYNQYIKSCLASLATKANKKKTKKKKQKAAIKYTAMELYRKKIVLEVDGVDVNKFKDVMFEIAQQDDDCGKFDISAKFYGVNVVEKVEIVFQDLLQLQYEGVSVMKMFEDRAKINVNLLIFLLNKKFYGK